MSTTPINAVIIAGGEGTRMKRSGVFVRKPLIRVAGVTLLERNFHKLVQHGFRRVHVALPHDAHETRALMGARLHPLARVLGVELIELTEHVPLGNIGAIQLLAQSDAPTLVVLADNLTTLNLRELVSFHVRQDAALTLAAHLEPFRMPFGELVLGEDSVAVRDYREKPVWNVLVSSAVMALGAEAIASVPLGTRCGISDLCRRLIDTDRTVVAFRHDAHWIDINDQAAIARAEAIVAENGPAFDCWLPEEGGGHQRAEYLVIAQASSAFDIHEVDSEAEARARASAESGGESRPLTTFDDVLLPQGQPIRCHLFRGRPKSATGHDVLRDAIAARVGAALALTGRGPAVADLEPSS